MLPQPGSVQSSVQALSKTRYDKGVVFVILIGTECVSPAGAAALWRLFTEAFALALVSRRHAGTCLQTIQSETARSSVRKMQIVFSREETGMLNFKAYRRKRQLHRVSYVC